MENIFYLLIAATLLSVSPVWAQQNDNGQFEDGHGREPQNGDSQFVPGLTMDLPTTSGSGCPQGTATAVLSPDQKSLSVLFDNYQISVGAGSGQVRGAEDCNLDIGFHVPPGFKVAIVKMEYRGFTSVPAGARATFASGFRYLEINGQPVDSRQLLRAKVFLGPEQGNFEIFSDSFGAPFSPCGMPFKLQSQSRLIAQSNPANQQVLAQVDSVDSVAPVKYSLRWIRCDQHTEPPPPHVPPPHPIQLPKPPPPRPFSFR